MKIGFITADLNHNHGWAHYSYELVQALHGAGLDLTVIASTNTDLISGVDVHPILPLLVPRERFLFPKLMMKGAISSIPSLLRDCDIIHCTVEPFAPLAAYVSGSKPFIQGGVGSYLRIDQWQRFPLTMFYRWAFESVDRLVCISHYTEKIARQMFPDVKTDVVPLGIDPSRFSPSRSFSDDEMVSKAGVRVEKHGPTIITVGGIKPRKGTLELVYAMAEVHRAIPEAQCLIIGNPAPESAYAKKVLQAIEDHGLEECVHVMGFLPEEELIAWYTAADLFVLPSINDDWIFEGYGLVHMEASAAGLPVIGTRDCGVEDAIVEGVTGLLVDQMHLGEQLPRAIIDLLTDPVKRRQMGEAGFQHARLQTWERVAAQMIAVYEDVLNGR